jgi:hypothetical protein
LIQSISKINYYLFNLNVATNESLEGEGEGESVFTLSDTSVKDEYSVNGDPLGFK